ncbi:MAG TPA: two-component regulator propeller domain-containing protein [Xanthomonadaceae bacterium]|nr:two-component regulator propeller domain-containing protein [Xanthomonadaceae bacterium]
MRVAAAVVALLLWLAPRPCAALEPDKAFHHYVRDTWSIQEGLPQISVLAIAQDRDGYLWTGTQSGLARFDGVRFTTYTPATEPALPGIWVEALLAASDGRLWIGTYKGVAVHDDAGFATVPAVDPERWPAPSVQAFAESADGTIWVATTSGLFQVRDGAMQPVAGAPMRAHALLAGDDGTWVGARGAVHQRHRDGSWTVHPLPDDADLAVVNRLGATQGRIWAVTTAGLFVRADGDWERLPDAPPLGSEALDLLYADGDGNLWVGGDIGLARINDGRMTEFVAAAGPGGIEGLRIAFEDREGNLWLGSQWEGLTRLWNGWTRRYSVAEGLHERIVWSLAPDPAVERTWVGTNDGVSLLEDGRFRHVVAGSELPHPLGYNLLAEPDRLWIGTRRGLAILAHGGGDDGTVLRPPVFARMDTAQINGIVRDDDGTLWFVTTEGVYRLPGGDPAAGLRHYGPAQGLTDTRARFFFRDAGGRVLVTTQGGVFELRGDRFVPFGVDKGLPEGLDVTAITQLSDGRLVLATLTEMLYFLDGGRWHALGEAGGVPANSAFFLAEHEGDLWTGGIRGIARVPLADLHPFATGRIDRVRGEMLLNERGDPMSGQQGYCCNGAGNSKGFRDGDTLWLPSRDGVVALDTDAIEKNAVPPTVAIERVQAGEHWAPAHALAGTALPADARDLTFEFTVLSFQDPKSIGVDYRLQGYDRAWRTGDPLVRSARYTNLPPGRYVFEVRGRNNAGVAGPGSASLRFSISPRFHETRLFLGLLSVLVATLLFAGYRYQQHRYRRQRHALQRQVEQRTEALEVANHRFEEASQTDLLTGLRNRRYLANQLPADLAHYDREGEHGAYQGEAMVFALVKIDEFDAFARAQGGESAELLLRRVAQVLDGLVRSGDYVARWGDHEFLLVFRPMARHPLPVIGERIRAAVAAQPFDAGEGPVAVTVSIGLAEYSLVRDRGRRLGWESAVDQAVQAASRVAAAGGDGWSATRASDVETAADAPA